MSKVQELALVVAALRQGIIPRSAYGLSFDTIRFEDRRPVRVGEAHNTAIEALIDAAEEQGVEPDPALIQLTNMVVKLHQALEEIANYQPTFVGLTEEQVVEMQACPECQRAKQIKFPPSGLCNTHYEVVWKRDRENERRSNYTGTELKYMAREALAALDAETKVEVPA